MYPPLGSVRSKRTRRGGGGGQAGGRALGPSPELASGLALPNSAFLLFWRMALLPPPALALGPPLPPPAHTSVSTATLTINSSHTPAVRGSSGFGTGPVLHVETRPTFFKICSLQVARVPKVGLGAIYLHSPPSHLTIVAGLRGRYFSCTSPTR